MPKTSTKYQEHHCSECNQTTDYASKLNKGMATFLLTFARAVTIKGENRIRLTEIMVDPKTPEWASATKRAAEGKITQPQYNNFSHLCRHGFIVIVETGVFVLTKKGAAFLRGKPVEKAAIVDKRTHSNVGYVADADGSVLMTDIWEVMKSKDGWWSGWNYDIADDGSLIWNHQPKLAI